MQSRKSRNTGVTGKFGLGMRNEAEQRRIEFCQENALVIANTLFQHKRRLYTWASPDGQHWNQIDYILYNQTCRSSRQSAKTRSGAHSGSDHQLLIAKFRLKLKKVWKTTRSFRYHLNQIPYDYTVEKMNRFKGLGLVNRVPEALWTEVHNRVQGEETKTIQGKEMQEGKVVVWEGFTIAEERREANTREQGKDVPIWMQSSKE